MEMDDGTFNRDPILGLRVRIEDLGQKWSKFRTGPVVIDEHIVGSGQGDDPVGQIPAGFVRNAGQPERLLRYRLDRGQGILDPVVKLIEQQQALFLGPLGLRLVTEYLDQEIPPRNAYRGAVGPE